MSTSSVFISLYRLIRLSAIAFAVSSEVRHGIPSALAFLRIFTLSLAGFLALGRGRDNIMDLAAFNELHGVVAVLMNLIDRFHYKTSLFEGPSPYRLWHKAKTRGCHIF